MGVRIIETLPLPGGGEVDVIIGVTASLLAYRPPPGGGGPTPQTVPAPVAYWPFDGDANDDSGNNWHLTPANVSYVAGQFGQHFGVPQLDLAQLHCRLGVVCHRLGHRCRTAIHAERSGDQTTHGGTRGATQCRTQCGCGLCDGGGKVFPVHVTPLSSCQRCGEPIRARSGSTSSGPQGS